MKIMKIRWKNFQSYGNKWNEIDFSDNRSGLYLLVGENGAGKCLTDSTTIDVVFDDPEIQEKFQKYVDNTSPPHST